MGDSRNNIEKIFLSFFSITGKSINCLQIGIRFFKIYKTKCRNEIFYKIIKWVRFKVLNFLTSKYCFLYFYKKMVCKKLTKKKNFFSNKQIYFWKILRKLFLHKLNSYGFIIYKKKKLNILSAFLWETYGKFFSLLPINFTTNFNFGENLVDNIQNNELNFSVNYFKEFLLHRYDHFKILNKFRYNFFFYFFQISPEHVYSGLGENVFSSLFVILSKILLIKIPDKYSKKKKLGKNLFFLNKKDKEKFTTKFLRTCEVIILHSLIKGKKEILLKLLPELSFKHSTGLFCSLPLRALSVILEYRGLKIQKSLKNKVEQSNRYRNQNLFFFELNSLITVDATHSGNQGRLLNHSCKTNCFTKNINHGSQTFVFIISKRSTKFLEELCYDYRINIDDLDFDQIQCLCYDFACKKEVMI